ncbi:MAG: 16S rRNA (guanine(527)-N(7))-methyltransferase RsmG [Candidatus Acidiferrales bacterium]
MLSLTNTQINEVLKPYGVLPAPEIAVGIKNYIELLLKWNKSVSLTTVTKVDQILAFHFGESLFALPMLPVEKSRLADVGSGAGFPGIPLAMVRPSLDVTLIEPNAKKFAFLSEVIRQLSLPNVSAVRGRTDDLQSSNGRFEIVTARAVGQFSDLIGWTKDRITSGGKLILWVGDEDAKKIISDKRFEWDSPVRIPGTDRRSILSGTLKNEKSI